MSHVRLKGLFACVLVLGVVVLAHKTQAQTIMARSQLRRTTDPSPRAAYGTVLMSIDTRGRETFQVNVTKLGEDNFGQFIREEPGITTNIVTRVDLPPLNRTSVKKGDWSRTLIGTNQAPLDLLADFGDLTGLSNNEVIVAQPDIPDVTTSFTNIVAGVTNISLGVTNIVGNTTNIINGIVIPNPGQTSFVFAVLWAPLPGLSAKPSLGSFHRHAKLAAVGDNSPNATGTVDIRFTGTTGRSVFNVRAANLTSGQQYTLFIANNTSQVTTVMIPIDTMTQKDLGSKATFVRDTQFGDPLPQTGEPVSVQARDVGDLSGHIIQIRDAFDTVHLAGVIP